jgi:CheY-like chemotaxis protein
MKIPLKLVVVEDSVADAELLARHLAKAGLNCDINRVQTEPEFLAALHGDKPDLILSDFSLPEFSGLRALDLAVIHAPDTPFIYVSGTIGEERAIEAPLGAGAHGARRTVASPDTNLPHAEQYEFGHSAAAKSRRVA